MRTCNENVRDGNGSSVMAFMSAARGHLSCSERRVADVVCREPDAIAGMSMERLARLSYTSDPTIARFCKKLGFSGFNEFRAFIATNLYPGPERRRGSLGAEHGEGAARAVFDRSVATLLSVRKAMVAGDQLVRVAERLIAAEGVHVCGFADARLVAQEAQARLLCFGIPAFAYTEFHVFDLALSLLRPNDVFLVISGSGKADEEIRAARVARHAGALVVGLTRSRSPLAAVCDHVLAVDADEEDGYLPLAIRIAQLTVLGALVASVAGVLGCRLPAAVRLDLFRGSRE